MEFAKRYSLKGNEVDEDIEITTIYKPMNIDFCENLDILYNFSIKPISNVLEHYMYLAKEVNKFKKDQINDSIKSERYVKKLKKLSKDTKNNNQNLIKITQQNRLLKIFIIICLLIIVALIFKNFSV